MNENELKKLWQISNGMLEKSLKISSKQNEDITHLKVQNFVSSMKPIKIFTLLAGIIWVGLGSVVVLSLFISGFSEANLFFLFSAAIQVGLTAIAVIIYLYQVIKIYQVDITESLLETQEKLASLKNSTLWVTRILFLQLPVWTTFYWNESMIENGNLFLWIVQSIVTILFAYVAVWLFFNIRLENKDKKWFRLIFKGKEWEPIIRSMELLQQIKEYKTED